MSLKKSDIMQAHTALIPLCRQGIGLQHAHTVTLGAEKRNVPSDAGNLHRLAENLAVLFSYAPHR